MSPVKVTGTSLTEGGGVLGKLVLSPRVGVEPVRTINPGLLRNHTPNRTGNDPRIDIKIGDG